MTDPRDLLDGSHFDHAVGPNAMRWAPEPIPIREDRTEDTDQRIARLLGHAHPAPHGRRG